MTTDYQEALVKAREWRKLILTYPMDFLLDGEIALMNLLAAIDAQENKDVDN